MTSTHRGKMDCFKGCMLGGAVGDALGAPIEFMSLGQIRTSFGADGISGYAPAYGRQGAITDDTQMSLFTAEGLILSRLRDTYRQPPGVSLAVYHAYLRWLSTQEPSHQARLIKAFGTCSMLDGQLMALQELHSQRAPGRSCLSALGSGRREPWHRLSTRARGAAAS